MPSTSKAHLVRVLRLTVPRTVGKDVEALRRGAIRYLNDGASWVSYQKMTTVQARTFGPGMKNLTLKVEAKAGLKEDGVAGPAVDHVLRQSGSYDATSDELLLEYAASVAPLPLWYPQVKAPNEYFGPLHITEGIPGNYARDFLAPGGTPVVASFDCEVTRWSGHDPFTGLHGPFSDVFGWSIYIKRKDGCVGYLTHLGTRTAAVGKKLKAGELLGSVGHWPGDPPRSHTHFGITSPKGNTDAKALITAIANAPKVPAL